MKKKSDILLALGAMTLLTTAALWGLHQHKELNCIHIFYDQTEDSNYSEGRNHAMRLQRLLVYFPEFAQIIRPIESYQSGDLMNCPANFYIGSYRDNPLPTDFLYDFKHTSRMTTWIGYNIWQIEPDLESIMGVRFLGLTPIQVELQTLDHQTTQILAQVPHVQAVRDIPYIIKNNNRAYVAELPFPGQTKAKKYQSFIDLLFVMLERESRRPELLVRMKKELNENYLATSQ